MNGYSRDTGESFRTHWEEQDAYDARIELKAIIRRKEDLVTWLDDNQNAYAQTSKNPLDKRDHYKWLSESAEEGFNDLWYQEWYRLAEIHGGDEYKLGIPTCETLRRDMKRERDIKDLERRRITMQNPQTHADMGRPV